MQRLTIARLGPAALAAAKTSHPFVFSPALPVSAPGVARVSFSSISFAWRGSDILCGRRTFASAPERSEDDASSGTAGVQLTGQAVARLNELQGETPGTPVYLRLEVEGGGCSGFQYQFSLDDSIRPGDRLYEQGGAKLVSDDLSLEFLRGSVVDFESDLMRSGFVVADNPNASSSCGCGSSFVAR